MNDYLITLLKSQAPSNQLMNYVKDLVRPTALEELNQTIVNCQRCTKPCVSRQRILGKASSPIMLLLPYPIHNDKVILTYLYQLLYHFHLSPQQVTIVYTVFGMFYDEDTHTVRPPFEKEVINCLPFLRQVIEIIEPKAIFCMSSLASQVFTQEHFADCLHKQGYFNQIALFTATYPQLILKLKAEGNRLAEDKEALFYATFKKMLTYLRKTYPSLNL